MTRPTGLRRFVGPPARSALPAGPQPARPPGADRADGAEKCEVCGAAVGEPHGHVVDVENRALMCACRPCFLLFTHRNANPGRFRAVPERYLHDPGQPLHQADWERLGIPVGSAFFLRGANGVAAFYPSPAGATECLLDLDAWNALAASHPLLGAAAAETEAILIRATDERVECFLVPIDVCYRLVGTVRVYWKGFDGGEEARDRIDELFAEIRTLARPFEPEE